jgi:hypothetical protein
MLSKYQSAIFLLALGVAVYAAKGSLRPFRSKAALTCYAVALAMVVPHLVWLTHHHFLPVVYMQETTCRPWAIVLWESIVFLAVFAAYAAPAVALYAWAGGHG